MTLNSIMAVILPNWVALEANYVKVVQNRPALSATKIAIYNLWRYLQRLPGTSALTIGTPLSKAII